MAAGTDPYDADTDGDGLDDGLEINVTDSDPLDANSPYDTDDIPPGDEFYGIGVYRDQPLDPRNEDTDGDGVPETMTGDYENIANNTDESGADPLDPGAMFFVDNMPDALDWDSDNDGLLDGDESATGGRYMTDPNDPDTDGDGLGDGLEVHVFGTNPTTPYTDGDDLNDYDEIFVYGTDPSDDDSDDDGVDDGTEVLDWVWGADPDNHCNPLCADTDGDGINDGATVEGTYLNASGTAVAWSYIENNTDTDGDGIPRWADADSDWSDWEMPDENLEFRDRTEWTYEGWVVTAHPEWHVGPLNPGNRDTDGDGYSDAIEVAVLTDPLDARDWLNDFTFVPTDADGDGVYSVEEQVLGLGADLDGDMDGVADNDWDCDGDSLSDGQELHPSQLGGFDPDHFIVYAAKARADTSYVPYGTSPSNADTDADSLSDYVELTRFAEVPSAPTLNQTTNGRTPDTDYDGLWDYEDHVELSEPPEPWASNDTPPPGDAYDHDADGIPQWRDWDDDSDWMIDGDRYPDRVFALDPDWGDADYDDDGIFDGLDLAFIGLTDWDEDGLPAHADADADNDTIPDGVEVGLTAPVLPPPLDCDSEYWCGGLRNFIADADSTSYTDPRNVDTDFDTVNDGNEDFNRDGWWDTANDELNPEDRDTDRATPTGPDYLVDGYEFYYHYDGWVDPPTCISAILADTDGDTVSDLIELAYGSDPCDPDSDGDGYSDGNEWAYGSDPTSDDSDNDGVPDGYGMNNPPANGDIESKYADTDGDGIINIMDVDSDDDWIWDGMEDLLASADGDSMPDVLDGDIDNDNLGDRFEMANDTHPLIEGYADSDWDNDGLYDGEEYHHKWYHIIVTDSNSVATHYKLYDTDGDSLSDGFELARTGPIAMGPDDPTYPWAFPTNPPTPGTIPDYGMWDAMNGSANSDPRLHDSDGDGLWDDVEDANWNGIADAGETYPLDSDSDDDGVLDGFEAKVWESIVARDLDYDLDGFRQALDRDSDNDLLWDGLEYGLQMAMPAGYLSPLAAEDYDGDPDPTYDVVDSGQYTTDPLDEDTDDDGLVDGGLKNINPGEAGEDVNLDGAVWYDVYEPDTRMGPGNPYDAYSEFWYFVAEGGLDESDPNRVDTDRGGVDDGTEVFDADGIVTDPVLRGWAYPWAGDDCDLDIYDNAGSVVNDTMAFGPICPETFVAGTFSAVNTTVGVNPDTLDGPSGCPTLPVYAAWTALDWISPLPGSTYEYPEGIDTDDLWIPYSYLTVEHVVPTRQWPLDMDQGVIHDFEVTLDLPPGVQPGVYYGTVYLLTQTAGPEEYPYDSFTIIVWVGECPDIDVRDDDGYVKGVGPSSIPPEYEGFPIEPQPGEMVLVGLPGMPDYDGVFGSPLTPLVGAFQVANPNTHPNEAPHDDYNDLNFLMASPFRDAPWYDPSWEAAPGDPQGNIDLHNVMTQYEFVSGPIDPTSAISIGYYDAGDGTCDPMEPFFHLSEVESLNVCVDTDTLVAGYYDGWVRIFDDTSDDGVWTPGEVSDTFRLYFALVHPDLDIHDDYQSLEGNVARRSVAPGEDCIDCISFQATNASPATNWDGWDGPAFDEPITKLTYYDCVEDTHYDFPASVVVGLDGEGENTFEVVLRKSPLDDDTSLAIGEIKHFSVDIPAIPTELPAGDYMPIECEWLPDMPDLNCGWVYVGANGKYTGVDPDMVEYHQQNYLDPLGLNILQATEVLLDYFGLVITVEEYACVEVATTPVTATAMPGGVYTAEMTVENIGNVAVDATFGATTLVHEDDLFILDAPSLDPESGYIAHQGSMIVDIAGQVPDNAPAGDYYGSLTALPHCDESQDAELVVTVQCVPEFEVCDSCLDLTGNSITLVPDPGETDSGHFQLNNLGNCDLEGLDWRSHGLPEGVVPDVELPTVVPYEGVASCDVMVSWIDPTVLADTYEAWVVITAEGAPADSFRLFAEIAEIREIEFTAEGIDAIGNAGETSELELCVRNAGNVNLDSGISIGCMPLVGATLSAIGCENITIDTSDPIGPGETVCYTAYVEVPSEVLAQTYTGTWTLFLDGVDMGDIGVALTLERGADFAEIFPNPYKMGEHNGGIHIALGSYDETPVVKVYDMFGGLVIDLSPDSGSDAGRNGCEDEVQWAEPFANEDGKSVASGMYIVTIDTGKEVLTRKIMIIK
ncbi:MAG: hypothetical protein JXB46_03530 [Candidatus Eisenbacteria bacterium]|nr:hypothetical protein [Candidatus Eisenbacteria bacterium]